MHCFYVSNINLHKAFPSSLFSPVNYIKLLILCCELQVCHFALISTL